jgi:hypothetical protein
VHRRKGLRYGFRNGPGAEGNNVRPKVIHARSAVAIFVSKLAETSGEDVQPSLGSANSVADLSLNPCQRR